MKKKMLKKNLEEYEKESKKYEKQLKENEKKIEEYEIKYFLISLIFGFIICITTLFVIIKSVIGGQYG